MTWGHGLRNIGILSALMVGAAFGQSAPTEQSSSNSEPLVLEDFGSFFVGGETKNRGPEDDVTIHQMYVEYHVPAGTSKTPVVMTHGCCLSSKTWETTPDGRMGWEEYFLRQQHPVYLTDQVGRARSGFDATPFNLVREGELEPSEQPEILHSSHQRSWDAFRFGPSYGETFPGLRFPIEAIEDFWPQMIPDLSSGLPTPNPNYKALSDLARELDGAILMGHSQSGRFPIEAALVNMEGVKGIISIEGSSREDGGFSQEEIETLTTVPILVIYGDFLELGPERWQQRFEEYTALVQQINDAGGNATMWHLPAMGIMGNSHMLMQDDNSIELADMIVGWIDENVEASATGPQVPTGGGMTGGGGN